MNLRLVVCCAAAAGLSPAQDSERLRAELLRAQRELQVRSAEAEQLLDARIRHDLGLPPVVELDVFRGSEPATSPRLEQAQRQLAAEEEATANLSQRLEQLRRAVEQQRQRAEDQARVRRQDDEWITVPVPALESRPVAVGTPPVAVPDRSEGEAAPLRVVPNLPPVQAQIHGSEDRSLVALALFRAAQALIDRAAVLESQGHVAAAAELDEQARQRLLRAAADLAEVVAGDRAAHADLFQLGRCRELLFRIAERRDGLSVRRDAREYQRREAEVREPFLSITARDVVVVDRTEQPGIWGRAAQAALEHFRWMNLHGPYAPRTALESITWPGQR